MYVKMFSIKSPYNDLKNFVDEELNKTRNSSKPVMMNVSLIDCCEEIISHN